MCLVEANNALVASCAMPVINNMIINTSSRRIENSRNGVLEFLLINHPLDCPICDQGGECDLQDITLVFGSDRGRYYESKRAVDNINCLGPFVKTVMTRCIHCTRCVRFLNEYSDVYNMGVIGRGNSMEIGTYIESFIEDEIWANIIDLCPVGALTSMPYAFSARPWELTSIESIDILDALASSIRMDVVNNQIVRILPCINENLNEEWITNKARFSYDALTLQRFYYPKIKIGLNLVTVSWYKGLMIYINELFSNKYNIVEAICDAFTDLETSLMTKNFFNSFGCNNLFYEDSNSFEPDFRGLFLLNTNLVTLETCSLLILISTNIRMENPLLNSRIRKNYLSTNLSVLTFGLANDYLTYPAKNIGNSTRSLIRFFEGKHPYSNMLHFRGFRRVTFNVKYNKKLPILLMGSSIFSRKDNKSILYSSFLFSHKLNQLYMKTVWNSSIVGIVSDYLGRISCYEVGITSSNKNKDLTKNIFTHLLGGNSILKVNLPRNNSSFTVLQSCIYNTSDLSLVNLVFPVLNYTERISTYLNIEGTVRVTKPAITSYKSLLSDIEIFRMLLLLRKSYYASNFSIFSNFDEVNLFFKHIIDYGCCFFSTLKSFLISSFRTSGFLYRESYLLNFNSFYNYYSKFYSFSRNSFRLLDTIFARSIYNYYNSDIYSRNSKIMSLTASKILLSNFSKSIIIRN